jgi:hypothetical protein
MTGVTASPTTAWTPGQHVLLGNNQKAHWTGTAWASDAAVMAADSETQDAEPQDSEPVGAEA